MVEPPADGDWGRWSRDAVQQLAARVEVLREKYGLTEGTSYRWDVDEGVIRFGDVVLPIVCVGTVAGGTFRGWANDSLPSGVTTQLDDVVSFGREHDLGLLIEPEFGGGHAEALEVLAIAGRVLDADGCWIEADDIYFLVFDSSPG